ncbi:TIGR03982 family His-Xaa-Ser system protein [Methylophaga thalassica]|uniref:TIGR03982 family His-Xaa-Ser system protein n=1 Tax=Methylophaga aminisulfidivorans TaxID=230105 RepID=UPI0024E23AF8|nr:TIGR03982 family His-Xaa-Ser system protein [Methylophaga aminisulfidivorans]
MTKIIVVLLTIIAVCLIIIVFHSILIPQYAKIRYSNEFKSLSIDCDIAMHNEALLRERAAQSDNEKLYTTAQIEMIVCHKYDMTRKKMLSMGVEEDYLSYLNLEALQNQKIPLSVMIEPHRMNRF